MEYDHKCDMCRQLNEACGKDHSRKPTIDKPRFGHPDCHLDTDPSRQLQPIKRASADSTASASASTLSPDYTTSAPVSTLSLD